MKTAAVHSDLAAVLVPLLRQHGVVRAGLFGSRARGTPRDDSDLDIVVEFAPRRSLFDLIRLRADIHLQTGLDADIVTYRSLHPIIRDKVLREQRLIL